MRLWMDDSQTTQLIERIDPKYQPVWQSRSRDEQIALARYFLPHRSRKAVVGPTRPRILKWYCPFACQKVFASGHRYCINVYTGCAHHCVYCYAAAYEPETVNPKKTFEKLLAKDTDDLNAFDVPPAPVHLSNSTDPFQPIEQQLGCTKLALEYILKNRSRFTTVTVLTKNPLRASQPKYVELSSKLARNRINHHPGCIVEVSLAFLQETARKVYDPHAPSVPERMQGIRRLREAAVPVVLRIDPLFPRNPITDSKTYSHFSLPEPQTLDDLKTLLDFANDQGVRHIVYSTAKIVQSRHRTMNQTMQKMKTACQAFAAPQQLHWQGGSYRIPRDIAQEKILDPFLQACQDRNLTAKFCKQNLITTP